MITSPKAARPSTTSGISRKSTRFVVHAEISSGQDAKLLLPESRIVRNKINNDEKISKKILRDVYSAENSSSKQSQNDTLAKYMLRLRSDIRVLKVFSSKILDFNIQHLDSAISRLISGNYLENIGNNDRDTELRDLLLLIDVRDNMMFDICLQTCYKSENLLSENLDPLPILCTDNLINFFHLCKQSINISDKLRILHANVNSTDLNMIIALKEKNSEMEQQLVQVTEEKKKIKTRYDIISTDNRNQTILRLQRVIDNLEDEKKGLTAAMEELRNEKKVLSQNASNTNDALLHIKLQLESLKQKYDNEVSVLKPAMEQQVYKSTVDKREMNDLHQLLNLCAERFSQNERRFEDTKKELEELREDRTHWKNDSTLQTKRYHDLAAANERMMKMSHLTMAAKMEMAEQCKCLQEELKNSAKRVNDFENIVESKNHQIKGQLEKIQQLQSELNICREEAVITDEKLYRNDAEIESQKLMVEKLNKKIADFEKVGISSSKRVEWDQLLESLQLAQNQIKKLKIELATANRKLYESMGSSLQGNTRENEVV